MSEVEITTDGSCLGNPGPGGWACILRCGQHERVLQGGVADTTNNRMELIAAIEGLRALKRASQVTVLTDSEYVRRGITEFLPRWKANGWRGSTGSGESGFVGGARGVGRLPRGDVDARPRTLRATESRTV
ncbi:MAG TPA: RNase H family protein [Bryobacteraceae bacterium]|nr:RNase H family protein [Bryobacteraceae bacterium]